MPDLADGETFEMKGSGAKPYQLKNVGGVYSCTCPAWRNQSTPIERRTCKHLRKLRGDAAEEARLDGALPQKPVKAAAEGEEAAGPPVLLAETWDNALDLAGWWMSEKLDGVRAYWDGKQFISRQGNLYHAPDWFVAGLPETPLDGELWIGRKAFQRTVGIVRRQDKPDIWKEVRYVIFDAPALTDPFEERMAFLRDGVRGWKSKFAAVHDHVLCKGVDHLREELRRVEGLQGEGLMLREPGSKYAAGRSSTLLKVKTFRDDEAVVIGHEPGKGKHAGRLGALTVKLASGKVFSVGTGFSDKQRQAPPPVGATITFRYQELSDAGIPRFPSFVGVRADVGAPSRTSPPAPPRSGEGSKTTSPPAPPRSGEGRAAAPPSRLGKGAGGLGSDPPPSRPGKGAGGLGSDPPPSRLGKGDGGLGPKGARGSDPKRYFEFTEDGSSKFWEVAIDGKDVTTRWGKIGTAGQTKTKTFADEAKARKEYDKLLAEKTEKGYIEKTPT